MISAVLFAMQQMLPAEPGELIKSSLLENNVAYLRVGNVGKNLPDEIRSAQTALAATNAIAGTVLDLRFADGSDADTAKAVTDLFASKKLPVAVLVNAGTSGAAVALAKSLRDARLGLVFGTEAGGLNPDVMVPVAAGEEKDFLKNPYGTVSTNRSYSTTADTNGFLPFVDHTSEADLVRARVKDGEEDPGLPAAVEPPVPFIRDPALARGIDFIRGWSVWRLSHS